MKDEERFMACHGPCNQGRSKCPTPEACEVPEPPSKPWDAMIEDIAVMLVMVAVAIALAGIL